MRGPAAPEAWAPLSPRVAVMMGSNAGRSGSVDAEP